MFELEFHPREGGTEGDNPSRCRNNPAPLPLPRRHPSEVPAKPTARKDGGGVRSSRLSRSSAGRSRDEGQRRRFGSGRRRRLATESKVVETARSLPRDGAEETALVAVAPVDMKPGRQRGGGDGGGGAEEAAAATGRRCHVVASPRQIRRPLARI
ncbi:hypothetical protein OsI_28487 [Oryza sativa Indica Group]|uniref:Uncharacterized protein n=1 Tax=Oryza sativa subsp. indica TaxID=39946 RepID=B8B8X5_ORYSI|nr:hypothetical protein OsI_28487 [Oryza sativa Indica Group]